MTREEAHSQVARLSQVIPGYSKSAYQCQNPCPPSCVKQPLVRKRLRMAASVSPVLEFGSSVLTFTLAATRATLNRGFGTCLRIVRVDLT